MAFQKKKFVNSSVSCLKNPSSWQEEGVDHINISIESNTWLGRFLNLRWSRRFDHPVIGSFMSLNNIWYFTRTKEHPDELRMLPQLSEIRCYLRANPLGSVKIKNFEAVILHSAYVRLLQNFDGLKGVLESTLPFDHYHYLSGDLPLATRHEYATWLIEGYEEIRSALKARRSPDFSWILESGRVAPEVSMSEIYGYLVADICGEPNVQYEIKPIDDWEQAQWVAYDRWVALHEERKARAEQMEALTAAAAIQPVSIVSISASSPEPIDALTTVTSELRSVPVVNSEDNLNTALESAAS